MGCWEVVSEFRWSNNKRVEIVYWILGKLNINSNSQLSCTTFPAKYGNLDIYNEDTEKIFIIDHEQLQFDKTDGWNLIGIPEKEDGTFSDHEYFCIYDDLFDRIQSTW